MSSIKPGTVFVKEYCFNNETEINLLKNDTVNLTGTFLDRINIPGLDANRQWYLYEEV